MRGASARRSSEVSCHTSWRWIGWRFQTRAGAPIWSIPRFYSGGSAKGKIFKENMEMKKNQKGFSLIELLIVVAIILIIAAIAIPNLLRARMAANESSAVGTLRSMNTANATYQTLYNVSFANGLPALGGATVAAGVVAPCTAANLIDNVLSASNTPTKSGYNFNYVGANPNTADTLCTSDTTYTITAVPITVGGTGNRSFFTDQSGIIRQNPNGVVPTVADLPLN